MAIFKKQDMNKISYFIWLLLFLSCQRGTEEAFFVPAKNPPAALITDSLQLDSLPFQPILSSYLGHAALVGDSLYFVDKEFGFIYVYALNGELHRRFLGKGRGPNEVPVSSIDGFQVLANNTLWFQGPSYEYALHQLNGKRLDEGRTDWQRTYTKAQLVKMTHPPYDAPILYSFVWGKFITRSMGSSIYFPARGYIDGFNTSDNEFLQQGRVLGVLDTETSPIKVTRFLGRFPPLYQQYHYIIPFSYLQFDIDQQHRQFYVNFEADSVIYQYNEAFEIQAPFGRAGKQMNQNYLEFPSSKELSVHEFLQERRKKGYYNWLEYVEATDMLFRSYQKGEPYTNDGLQVYHNQQLIADVEVPKGFRVLGYRAPWYYSHVLTHEREEQIYCFRFQLPAIP